MNDKQFSDKVLAKAFRLLYGDDWHKYWEERAMADDMRAVIRGGDRPAIAFENWVKCINFLQEEQLKQKQA